MKRGLINDDLSDKESGKIECDSPFKALEDSDRPAIRAPMSTDTIGKSSDFDVIL